MRSWFQRGVERGVKQGVQKALAEFTAPGGKLSKMVEDCLWTSLGKSLSRTLPLTLVGFVWALRLCFVAHGCTRDQACDLANSTVRQYLADEKIKFGDKDYGWTREDAEEIADEYEFRHWEAA